MTVKKKLRNTKVQSNPNKGFYWGKVGCLNCNTTQSHQIVKGRIIDVFVREDFIKCKNCGCYEMMRSFNEYSLIMNGVKKGILNNIAEDDILPNTSTTKHLHYG